jgi:ABC-type nickel/cobalt efflux system permease component RcnA
MFVFSLYRYNEVDPVLAAIAVSALGAVAARSVLIAIIDVTSWNAINLQYMVPAAPFVLIFTVVGIFLGWRAIRGQASGS